MVTGIEGGIMPRSGGLNSFDWGAVRPETLNIGVIMMFIGGGSASTAGGIKITTFLLLAYVIWAELRGDPDITVGSRSIGPRVVRTAITIALLAVMLVTVTTFLVMLMTDFDFDAGAVRVHLGVRDGRAEHRHHAGPAADAQIVIIVLMFLGRVGTIAAGVRVRAPTAMPRYRLPEEQPIIG